MSDLVYATVSPKIHESMQETAAEMVKTPIPQFVAAIPRDGYIIHAVRRTDRIVDQFSRNLPNWVPIPFRSTLCGGVKHLWANHRKTRDEWDFTKHEDVVTKWVSRRGPQSQHSVCPRCTARVRAILKAANYTDGSTT